MKGVIAFLRRAIALHRKEAADAKHARQLFDVAEAYNALHTYKGRAFNRTWMCPSCNTVHKATDMSFWTGLQFPACCAIPAGDRLTAATCATKRALGAAAS